MFYLRHVLIGDSLHNALTGADSNRAGSRSQKAAVTFFRGQWLLHIDHHGKWGAVLGEVSFDPLLYAGFFSVVKRSVLLVSVTLALTGVA